ncbi:hypothetical protein [Methanogenium organophilum]|uniref:SpoVT-AbrB domain-containing protein n=1 Tax=Methanogenium organophilum TaxID=2199 RepID=A0A9X9S522_METOG|nr:hypothetical protein [Methanogenium organophilum]WAI01816.1 hypothetical protein OU421_02780 [Methanogenium organophilum]
MVKILKSGKQYRINIPKDILSMTGWNEDTELIITPLLKDPTEPINQNTPIIIKKVNFISSDDSATKN